MKDNVVILISGYKRAGKDFVGSAFLEELEDSKTYSLATPLKDILATTMDLSLDALNTYKNSKEILYTQSPDGELTPITDFRSILQIFGSEAMKKWFTPNVWINIFNSLQFKEKYIIIPDWRFPAEIEEISKVYKNVITIRVNDDNIKNTDMHVSETSLDSHVFDYSLNNTKKDSAIIKDIKELIKDIKG